jgi:hypothetical protein
MIFSLEALEAGKGDSLVLHWGQPQAPRFIVIDGGPSGVYNRSLRPRLQQLADRWKDEDDEKLHLDMMMVSHIDDDHIQGILDWMVEIEDGSAVPCNFATLWYNSFDAVLGNAAQELRSKVKASSLEEPVARVVAASVAQGRELRERADAMGVVLNGGFDGLVMASQTGKTTVTRGALKLHVIGPSLDRLKALQVEWDKHVKAHPDPVVTAAFVDRSVPNLSSIVVIAELDGKRMLLTGDARGDDILDGLKAGGFLDASGKVHFDLIKMPHHGSSRNMTQKWLEDVTADHYVISANGEHGNPDTDTMTWLCKARGDAKYTIHLTNEVMVDPKDGRQVSQLMKQAFAKNPGTGRQVVYRGEAKLSVIADVMDPVTY